MALLFLCNLAKKHVASKKECTIGDLDSGCFFVSLSRIYGSFYSVVGGGFFTSRTCSRITKPRFNGSRSLVTNLTIIGFNLQLLHNYKSFELKG